MLRGRPTRRRAWPIYISPGLRLTWNVIIASLWFPLCPCANICHIVGDVGFWKVAEVPSSHSKSLIMSLFDGPRDCLFSFANSELLHNFWKWKGVVWPSPLGNLMCVISPFPLVENRDHRSNDDCLESESENYVCSVQYCVHQLCTVQCTRIWLDLTVVCLLVRFSFSVVILCVTVYLC